MFRKRYLVSKQLVAATALALGASGVALAGGFDADNSMSRLGGDGYAYFNQPVPGTAAASAAWRQGNPNGLSERDLQALSSSSLAAAASDAGNAALAFASAPSDPSWRRSHPNGLTDRELQAAASSALAMWQTPRRSEAAIAQSRVANAASPMMSAKLPEN